MWARLASFTSMLPPSPAQNLLQHGRVLIDNEVPAVRRSLVPLLPVNLDALRGLVGLVKGRVWRFEKVAVLNTSQTRHHDLSLIPCLLQRGRCSSCIGRGSGHGSLDRNVRILRGGAGLAVLGGLLVLGGNRLPVDLHNPKNKKKLRKSKASCNYLKSCFSNSSKCHPFQIPPARAGLGPG